MQKSLKSVVLSILVIAAVTACRCPDVDAAAKSGEATLPSGGSDNGGKGDTVMVSPPGDSTKVSIVIAGDAARAKAVEAKIRAGKFTVQSR